MAELNHIDRLKTLLNETIGKDMSNASDYEILQNYIVQRTGNILGINTLKRLWKYQGAEATPHKSTLDILSNAAGFRNFLDFVRYCNTNESADNSDVVLTQCIFSKDLAIGQQVEFRWNPQRSCTVEYLGNNTFRVLFCEKTKLTPGDTFQTTFFAIGVTLIVTNLVKKTSSFPAYQLGKGSGLTYVKVLKN